MTPSFYTTYKGSVDERCQKKTIKYSFETQLSSFKTLWRGLTQKEENSTFETQKAGFLTLPKGGKSASECVFWTGSARKSSSRPAFFLGGLQSLSSSRHRCTIRHAVVGKKTSPLSPPRPPLRSQVCFGPEFMHFMALSRYFLGGGGVLVGGTNSALFFGCRLWVPSEYRNENPNQYWRRSVASSEFRNFSWPLYIWA